MVNPGTKYLQIAADLRARIATGALRPGDPVPSEADLAAQWRVARMTARAALLDLERAGLLTPGRPRTVARYEPLTVHVTRTADLVAAGELPSSGADAWQGDMTRAGYEPVTRIEVLRTITPPAIAAALGLQHGHHELTICRRLFRTAGGQPHHQATFWFPAHVAAGTPLENPEPIEGGLVPWLESHQGPLTYTTRISGRMPQIIQREDLQIPQGWPLLVIFRTATAVRTRTVLMASEAEYPADRTVLELAP
jgi:GntR family transcriptional regulator